MLIETQRNYINQVQKVIFNLYIDFNIMSNKNFREFCGCIHTFEQYIEKSAGFCKALGVVRISNDILLEILLDDICLIAAEYLEQGIEHLETAAQDAVLRTNLQVVALTHHILLIEEMMLKIIDMLIIMLHTSKKPHLQN